MPTNHGGARTSISESQQQLFDAIYQNNQAIVKKLIAEGVNVNARDHLRLYSIAQSGNVPSPSI